MAKFKLKVGIDLRDKRSALRRKYGTVEIEHPTDFLNKESEALEKLLRQQYQKLFRTEKVINIDVLDSLLIS